MVNRRELKEKAKKYESAAKYWVERVHKSDFAGYVKRGYVEEREEKASKNYVTAGDTFVRLEDFNKAIQNYKKAIEYAASGGRRKIQEKITQLESLSKTKKGRPLKRGKLERSFGFAIVAMASFLGALFLISFNLTGNVIGGVSQNNSNWISVVLFVLGMVFSFLYFKNKN